MGGWWERPRGSRAALVCLAAVGMACGGEGATPAADDAVRRDSAGIQVVETPLEAIPRGTLGEPVLVIGTAAGSPDQELYHVRTPWLAEDGRLVLANSGTREIRFYDAAGVLLRSVGGQGEGPGEYRMVAWVRPWRGDSLAVWDGFARRLTILDEEGALGRTLRLEAADGAGPRTGGVGSGSAGGPGGASAVDVLPGGRFLGRVGSASAVPGDTTAVLRDIGSYRVFDADGNELAPLADVLDSESFRFVSGDSRSVGPLPFGKSSAVAPLERAENGENGAVVVVSDNAGFAVRWMAADGAVRRIGRVPLVAEPVTDAIKAAYRAEREAVLGDLPAIARAAQMAMLEATPYPDSLPAHGDLVVGGGRAWLERYRTPEADGPGEWIAFDLATGVATALLTLPNGAELASVRGDTAVVVATDELGVQRVMVAPIAR